MRGVMRLSRGPFLCSPFPFLAVLFRNAMTFRFGSAVQAAPMTRVNRHTNY